MPYEPVGRTGRRRTLWVPSHQGARWLREQAQTATTGRSAAWTSRPRPPQRRRRRTSHGPSPQRRTRAPSAGVTSSPSCSRTEITRPLPRARPGATSSCRGGSSPARAPPAGRPSPGRPRPRRRRRLPARARSRQRPRRCHAWRPARGQRPPRRARRNSAPSRGFA